MRKLISAAFVSAAVAGVAFAAAPAPLTGFVSDKSKNYFGYYLPASPIKSGKWSVRNISIGGPDELKNFEAGRLDKAYGAVMVEFEDETSPVKTGEDGNPYHTGQIRVLPKAYAVGNGHVRFTGADKTLGAVTFDGAFSADFFKKPAADVPHPDDHPTLKGKLTVGAKTVDAAFTWFGGD